MKSVTKILKNIQDCKENPSGELNIRDILEAIVGEFGGPMGFANHVMLNYKTAKPGSQVRVRIMESLLRLLEKFEGGHTSTARPEDLAALQKILDDVDDDEN